MKKGMVSPSKNSGRTALQASVALALMAFTATAFADPAVTMAPPVGSAYSQSADGQSYDNAPAGADSVFQWQEVPSDQRVPIRRAVFDQGGYQLYDTQGETIVIPFTENNLYVMKFGRSTDGTTYFVNGGDAPILYVPRNGFLENAAVPGARWYPFSQDFHPAEPVFLGVAPSWDDYVTMGWYPDMVCYGGYWGYHPYVVGSVFFPSFGLSFVIGGHRYDGWEPYHHYYSYHPAPYRVTYINRNIYRFDNRSYREHDFFRGTGHPYEVHRDFNNGHRYGDNRGFGGRQDSGDRHNFGDGRGPGGERVFRGTGNPTYAHRDYPGSRDMPGGRTPNGGGNHTFGGDQSGNRPVFSGGFGHSSDNGNARRMPGDNGGSHSFPSSAGNRGSIRNNDNSRTFGGGNSTHTFGGGGDNTHNFPGHDSPNTGRVGGERPASVGSPRTFGGGFSHSGVSGRSGGNDRPSAPRSGGNDRPSGGNDHSGDGDHSGGGDRGGRH